ncbi:MAG: hypothetical protein AMXMBFR13_12850 [Phycisphaerae bacterium]
MINFSQVSKTFDAGRTFAVQGVNLAVEDGETFILLGSSGSGKTTLLRMINRLIDPTEGIVLLDRTPVVQYDVLALRRSIGYVFQSIGLLPHMSVEENVGIVLRLLGWRRRHRRARAHQMLELVGLEPALFARRLPRHLSGGQKQRVGVARALSTDPRHLLMDEPFGALDAISRDALQQEVLRLKAQLGKTIVFVTHDVSEALLLADRIGVMHDGRLEQAGPPSEIAQRPATDFVADLFASARRLSLRLADSGP